MAALRLDYLFPLAHLCHVTPAASWDLTLTEFALLIREIDSYTTALPRPEG